MVPEINKALVKRLIEEQFPQWKGLPIRAVENQGWDNRSFRLGEDKVIRLPSAADYAAQVEKENHWLPKLAPLLPVNIPKPIVVGKPGYDYPWLWSIYSWLEGESASTASIPNLSAFAGELASFLLSLHRIDPANGPMPGPENFYRGGSLEHYHDQTHQAIARLKGKIDSPKAIELWEAALKTRWKISPVWIHGDMSPTNLLVQNGHLAAVIDFGQLAIGDPACDLVIAWTFFVSKSHEAFKKSLNFDSDTWLRAKAWALWKALILASGLVKGNDSEIQKSFSLIMELL
jgi:aminoglycoside phosphotransferase (APT) family kinase protein